MNRNNKLLAGITRNKSKKVRITKVIRRDTSAEQIEIASMEVGPTGDILPIHRPSMVVKNKIFDPSNPNFTWPLKGESYAIPESELEPMYKIYDERTQQLEMKE